MPVVRTCSIADVTVPVRVYDTNIDAGYMPIWYHGSWFKMGPMLYMLWLDEDTWGLHFWSPVQNTVNVFATPPTTIGVGTHVADFADGILDVELRFQTTLGDDGFGVTRTWCDDTLIYEWKPWTAPHGYWDITQKDLISYLYTEQQRSGATPSESGRLGGMTATVWETGYQQLDPDVEAAFEVLIGEDGTPLTVVDVDTDWADWVATVIDGETLPERYVRVNSLYIDTSDGQGSYDAYGTEQDNGFVYTSGPTSPDGGGALRWVWYRYMGTREPNLSLAHHPVSNALLVTDAGLAADGSIGYWTVMNR